MTLMLAILLTRARRDLLVSKCDRLAPPGKLGPSGEDGDGEEDQEDDDEQEVPEVPAEGRKGLVCPCIRVCIC